MDRLVDVVGPVKPTTQVDHLAAFAAEWAEPRILRSPGLKRPTTGWTLETRHDSNRTNYGDEPLFFSALVSFVEEADGSFLSDFLDPSGLSGFLAAADKAWLDLGAE